MIKSFITGLGIGAVVTAIVVTIRNKEKQEMRDAFEKRHALPPDTTKTRAS